VERAVFPAAAAIVCASVAAGLAAPETVKVGNLRCEYRVQPLGIDTAQPRLSWTLKSEERGQAQTAYRVLVAESMESLNGDSGDLWDSGRAPSDRSVNVPYEGKELRSRAQCFWKVKVWDKDGIASGWSEPASWTMGLLRPQDWRGRWIGTPRAFSLTDPGKAHRFNRPLGYHAKLADLEDEVKWIQLDLGESQPVDTVRLHPLNHDGVKGFGFPLRFRIQAADDPTFTASTDIADHTQADYPAPGFFVQSFPSNGVSGRYLRLTVTRLWQRPTGNREFCFGLGEIEAMRGRVNLALDADPVVKDSEEHSGWGRAHLNDGCTLAREPLTAMEEGGRPDPGDAAILMRKPFLLSKPVRRALACISGLGVSELYLNGDKISDDVLAPGFTDYTQRVLYMTYDVTGNLREGENVVGVMLGNGFYSLPSAVTMWCSWYCREQTSWGDWPRLLLDVQIEFADGTTGVIESDETWKWSTGEITWNCLWTGERIDARLAKPGWSAPGYDDGDWASAVLVEAPRGRLVARQNPPIRVLGSVAPVGIDGDTFDFGAMYTGWLRLKTSGEAGGRIVVQGGPHQEMILRGDAFEVLEPRFTFRTIEPRVVVTGLSEPPSRETLTVRRVGADLESAGDFRCSNEYFNELHRTLLRTNRNYNFDHPMDPTREYSGWTQDVETMFETAVYLTDAATLYRKWWRDMADNQDEHGYLGSVVPYSGHLHACNGPWWSGMIVLTPWLMYQYYEDTALLEEAYPAMKSYVEFLRRRAEDGLIEWGLGDWNEADTVCQPKRTPVVVTSTCAYYCYARIVSQAAAVLGREKESRSYADLASAIKSSFCEHLLDPQRGLVGGADDSQTALVLPLYLGMIPEEAKGHVVKSLLENIHERREHLSTGFVGTPCLLITLSDFGHGDLAYRIANQRDYPSWTTLIRDNVFKEDWGGGNVQMPSCGGSIGRYFFQCLAGIRPDPSGPGFKRIVIRPDMVGDLTWVEAHYDSMRGRIVSSWRRDPGAKRFSLDVTIPANTTATVYVPAKDGRRVMEGGRPIAEAAGARFLRVEDGRAVFAIEAGNYHFLSEGI